jgi:predicted GNAT family acetyltransferase
MIREIKETELHELLNLYQQLHNNSMPEESSGLISLWNEILRDKNHHIIVAVEDDTIVSSCVCVIIPNLTHEQRPYALIENVITDERYRKKGLATACLAYVKEVALRENCYKIMLLTGSKKDSTLHFYEQSGFNKNDKTAFIQWL